MERRKFLKIASGGGVAVLAGGGVLFARQTRMVAVPSEPLLFFTPREYSIFHWIAQTVVVVPAGAPGLDVIPVARNADALLASYGPDAQTDFRRLLGLFDNALAGLLLCGTTAPFTQMEPEQRVAYMKKWQDHRLGVLRSGFVALKRLAASCYYGDPSTHRALGYPGPPEKEDW